MSTINKLKKINRWVSRLILLGVISMAATELWVNYKTKSRLHDTTDTLPTNQVALLLGTGKYLWSGQVNLYYSYRIQAASKLFKENKVSYFLISGDNSREDYDEPTTIKEDLVALGIPEDRIYLDYAGFRTLDSIVRAKKVFGQRKITIISQQFHNERAICIANAHGIDAVGFNAKTVSTRYGIKVILRERLARLKMVLDLLINKQPKFLGDPIQIPS